MSPILDAALQDATHRPRQPHQVVRRRCQCLGWNCSGLHLDAANAVMPHRGTVIDRAMRIQDLPKTKWGHLIRVDQGTVGLLRTWRAQNHNV